MKSIVLLSESLEKLCHRCEHRVRAIETAGSGPRYECSQSSAVWSCYMYKPVRPVVLGVDGCDPRPALGPAFISARMHGVKDNEFEVTAVRKTSKYYSFWAPKFILQRLRKHEKETNRSKTRNRKQKSRKKA